jgi:DNA-binding NarL/FixJ family response regulator
LSTYRSKSKPDLRVVGQDEAISILPASNKNAIKKRLTAREAEIARLVAAGLSNKQIAREARIAEGTVKIHLHKAYKKLGIANRSTLAVMVQTLASGVKESDEAAVVAKMTRPPSLPL